MKVNLGGLCAGQWPQAGFFQLHTSLIFKLESFWDPGKGKKIINCSKYRSKAWNNKPFMYQHQDCYKKRVFCLARRFWAFCEQAGECHRPWFSCPQAGCCRSKTSSLFSIQIIFLDVVLQLLCNFLNPFTPRFTWKTLNPNPAQCCSPCKVSF